MKIIFKIIQTLLICVYVSSCSGLFRPADTARTGSVTLALNAPMFETSARSASLGGATLYVSVSGDYLSSQTVTVSGSPVYIRFDNIPAGSTVRILITGETQSQEYFLYGTSKDITIRQGQNTASVVLEAKRSTPFVLWDLKPNLENKALYVMQTLPNAGSGQEVMPGPTLDLENNTLFDFCFDNNANLYILNRTAPGGGSLVSVNVYPYPEYQVNSSLVPGEDRLDNAYMGSVTCDNANVYVAGMFESSDRSPFKIFYTPLNSPSLYTEIPAIIPNVTRITAIAAQNGIVYAAYGSMVGDSSYTLNIAAFSTAGTKQAEILDIAGELGLTGSDSYDMQIKDLLIQDGALYALIRQQQGLMDIDGNDTNFAFYSRGGVIKLGLQDLKPDRTFGSGSIFGWTAQKQEITVNSKEISGYWPAPEDSTAFYGPVKFAAVKPKKLIIADDGASIEKNNYDTYTGVQKDSIIEIDLGSVSGSETDTSVSFDGEIGISL